MNATQVVAKRPIQRGAELSTSYVDPSLDAIVRQESLLYNHHFLCSCARCVNPQRLDRQTGLWITVSSTSGRTGGKGASHAIGATRPNPRKISAGATQEETADDDRGRDRERKEKAERESANEEAENDASDSCSSSSSSPGSDIADFVEAFAARSDDY